MGTKLLEHAGYPKRMLDGAAADDVFLTYVVVQDVLFAEVKALYRLDRQIVILHLLGPLPYHRIFNVVERIFCK
jgi:hypothetical protein